MKNKEMIDKIKDYADCADASYAMLDYIFKYENTEMYDDLFNIKRWQFRDNIIVGHSNNNKPTAYALVIEARFKQDGCFNGDMIKNNPINFIIYNKEERRSEILIKLSQLSQRTINFVNRFKLLAHQPNTDSGFSATLFEDTKNANQKIFAIRGTE